MPARSIKKPTEEELIHIIMHTSRTVWHNELPKKNLDDWLDNFKGEVFPKKKERFIALWLLSHFTYYNQSEVTHLCKVLYDDLIHYILSKKSALGRSPSDVVDEFFQKTNIVPVEEISGSSGFIAYFFRHINDLGMELFNFSIENVSNDTENIILIDDVTLTSGKRGQMYRFLKKQKALHPNKNFILLTLISSEASLSLLAQDFSIDVISAIKLDMRDKCFSQESDMFAQFPKLLNDCKKFAEYYGNKIGFIEPLGYANGQYAFGFFYNTPDNTLPIFWGQVNGWKPIIKRFHKSYAKKVYLKNERFI